MNKPASFTAPEKSYAARFTAHEFLEMLDCGAFAAMKVELLEGELLRVNPARTEHSRLQGEIYFLLRTAFGESARERVFVESGVTVSDSTVLGPDVLVARTGIVESRMVRPDETLLVVEVADETLARDLGEKASAYAGAGIPVYWVVDAKARAVHVMTSPSGDTFESREMVRFGEPLAAPGTNQAITLE